MKFYKTPKKKYGWEMVGYIIVLAALAVIIGAVAFSCAISARLVIGTPYERGLHNIKVQRENCLIKALKCCRYRWLHCNESKVVVNWGLKGWHANYRDEHGKLQDVSTSGTVLGTPMFEFDYRYDMEAKFIKGVYHIYVGKELWLAFKVYYPSWPKYKILYGKEKVSILEE